MGRGLARWLLSTLVVACGARTPLDGETSGRARTDAALDAGSASVDAMRPGRDAPDAGPVCVPGTHAPRRATTDLVFVIDRSGSMSLGFGGERTDREHWRWTYMEAAVAHATSMLDERTWVGATFFPNPSARPRPGLEGPCLTTIGLDVPLSPHAGAEVVARMTATDPAGGTPTGPAIVETHRQLETSPHPRRVMVLATDGAPNCNPDLTTPGCICTVAPMLCEATGGGAACLDELRTAAVIRDAHEAGIPVYVVGIDDPLDPTLAGVLDRLAEAGGRPRTTGPRRFYSALGSAELDEVLADVTSRIALCGFTLSSIPPAEDELVVSLDGSPLDPDAWAWIDREHGEIELLDAACDRARAGAHLDATVLRCD